MPERLSDFLAPCSYLRFRVGWDRPSGLADCCVVCGLPGRYAVLVFHVILYVHVYGWSDAYTWILNLRHMGRLVDFLDYFFIFLQWLLVSLPRLPCFSPREVHFLRLVLSSHVAN